MITWMSLRKPGVVRMYGFSGMIFTSKLGRTDPGQREGDQTLMKGPLRYFPPLRAVAAASPFPGPAPPPLLHPFLLAEKGCLSLMSLALTVFLHLKLGAAIGIQAV